MKIAFLHMTLGLVNRGSEVTTKLLASELSKNHDVTVFQSGSIQDTKYRSIRRHPLLLAPAIEPHNLFEKVLFRLHLNDNAKQAIAFTRSCLPDLLSLRPDIVFATNGSDQVKILKKYLPESKIVVIGHSGIGHDDLSTLRSKPDLFLAITRQAEDWAKAICSRSTKIGRFNNPLIPSNSRIKYKITGLPHPILLVVGALTPHKNIPHVVRVAQELGLSLILVGDGHESDIISHIFSSYLAPFRWIKNVEPEDLAGIYKEADAFCFVPDPQEAFGRVYIEAMSANLPIIASDDPIRRDLIGQQGFYAKVDDAEDLKSKLQAALASKKINYQKELEPYMLETVISKLEEDLNEITK